MWNAYTAPRSMTTSLACRQCGEALVARRGCRDVTLDCQSCGARYPLKDFASQIDDALEEFLSQHFCDRC